jgi:hypothetical protein
MTSRIDQAVVTFRKNIEAVNQFADLDRGLIEQTIQQLRERDARLLKANIDNPRLLMGNTITNLENIRRNDSLRPGFQALVNQSAVLLASYFASGVSQLFRSAIAGALEHGSPLRLEQHELKFTVKDVKSVGGDILGALPDLIAEGPGISFQDTKSIQRVFKDYLDIDIPRDEVTNDLSVELALCHVLVHNGGVVDRKCLKQIEESIPRTFRCSVASGESINFKTEEIRSIGATMIRYVQRLADEREAKGLVSGLNK